MATLARTLQKNNRLIYAALMFLLAALLVLSPAEATLGNVVKVVYLHGAAERVSTYAYLIAALLGLTQIALRRPALAPWTQAIAETAIGLWLAQLIISAPAQVLVWGAFTLNEPRVASALWILGLTALVYIIARWIGDAAGISFGAIANAVILVIVLRGSINVLHPIDPIIGSDSFTIKLFYAGIVIVTGALGAALASERAKRIRIP